MKVLEWLGENKGDMLMWLFIIGINILAFNCESKPICGDSYYTYDCELTELNGFMMVSDWCGVIKIIAFACDVVLSIMFVVNQYGRLGFGDLS